MSPVPPEDRDTEAAPAPSDTARPSVPITTAYRERTLQVHEARSALGEAVHLLRLELAALHEDNGKLREEWKALGAEVRWLREDRARLEQQLLAIRKMRIVRWTKGPRLALRRIRPRRQ